MSGLQFNVFCEIDPDLMVTAKVDSDGDVWIGLSSAEDRAMLTLEDAKALSRFLANVVSKQVTSADWDQEVTRKAAAAIKRANS